MNIPIATITDTNVDTAIILDDNSNNMIHINTEATQIINQTAFLEVSQSYAFEPETNLSRNRAIGVNYDRDNLIFQMNLSISSSPNNNPVLSPSTITDYSDNNNSLSYEGKVILYFFLLFILMIIILNKTL